MKANGRSVCIAAASISIFAADALPLIAQSADELAIPVRKGSGSTSKSASSEKTDSNGSDSSGSSRSTRATASAGSVKPTSVSRGSSSGTKPQRSSSSSSSSGSGSASSRNRPAEPKVDADLAAVHNLRSNLPPLADVDGGDNTSEDRGEYEVDAEEQQTEQSQQPQLAGTRGESSTQMVSVPGPTALAPMATVQAAERAQPAPNLYLPQPEEERGILSKIFRRRSPRSNAASAPPAQDHFNSDYATRGSAILPAVIRGNGYNGADLPIGGEDPYRLASLPATFRPTDLVQLPIQLCHYKNQLYLRQEAAASLCNMISAAAMQGLNIKVVSAYRDIGHQTRLYNQAVARRGADQKMVARPGKSEHNLGTTVDVTNSDQHTLKRSFGDTAEGRWLAANAHRFGWKMTVMSGNGRRSHNDEPWHLRYLGSTINGSAPISTIAQQQPQRNRRDVFGSIGRFLGLRD